MAQGVPSAMKSYAIGLLPLILKLKHSSEFVKSQWDIAKTYPKELSQEKTDNLIDQEVPQWTQSWYADNSSYINKLIFLKFGSNF